MSPLSSKPWARPAAETPAAATTTMSSRTGLSSAPITAASAIPAPATISGSSRGALSAEPSGENSEPVTDDLHVHLGSIVEELAVEVDGERRAG